MINLKELKKKNKKQVQMFIDINEGHIEKINENTILYKAARYRVSFYLGLSRVVTYLNKEVKRLNDIGYNYKELK